MTVVTPRALQRPQAVVSPARSPRARVAWTFTGMAIAIALVTTSALSIVGSVAYQPLVSKQRVFTGRISAVTVDVSSGEIVIERTAGINTVVTTTGVHGLTSPTDEERVVGRTLTIRSSCGSTPFNDRCRRNYVLHVQPGVALTADSAQGDVNITDMEGP